MCVVGMKWCCPAQAGEVGLASLCAQDLGWEEGAFASSVERGGRRPRMGWGTVCASCLEARV